MANPTQLEFNFTANRNAHNHSPPNQVNQQNYISCPVEQVGTPPYTSEILANTWGHLITRYFPEKTLLWNYTCAWSTRLQKRTLASCNLERKRIIVAQELNDPLFYRTLSPLLYHEMCHAVIGLSVSSKKGRRLWHGPEFKRLEAQHPEIDWLDLWIREGGWRYAIARHRARLSHSRRVKIKR